MDIRKLEAIARSAKTRAELEQLKTNVLARGDAESARLVETVLTERFPVRTKQRGGTTQTEATFKGRRESFDSGKEAYLWLLERLRATDPLAVEKFLDLQGRSAPRARGRRFASTREGLFPPGSPRASVPSYSAQLPGGWYADVNLSHKDKFATLLVLSHVCSLRYPLDWEFRPLGSTRALREHQEAVVRAKELLDELLRANRAG